MRKQPKSRVERPYTHSHLVNLAHLSPSFRTTSVKTEVVLTKLEI